MEIIAWHAQVAACLSIGIGGIVFFDGTSSGDGISSTLPLYCGPTNPAFDCAPNGNNEYDEFELSWCQYEGALIGAAAQIESDCLSAAADYYGTFGTYPPYYTSETCEGYGEDFRSTLEAINTSVVGYAAESLSLSIYGNYWNDYFDGWVESVGSKDP